MPSPAWSVSHTILADVLRILTAATPVILVTGVGTTLSLSTTHRFAEAEPFAYPVRLASTSISNSSIKSSSSGRSVDVIVKVASPLISVKADEGDMSIKFGESERVTSAFSTGSPFWSTTVTSALVNPGIAPLTSLILSGSMTIDAERYGTLAG